MNRVQHQSLTCHTALDRYSHLYLRQAKLTILSIIAMNVDWMIFIMAFEKGATLRRKRMQHLKMHFSGVDYVISFGMFNPKMVLSYIQVIASSNPITYFS